jgi:hypothetical protein
MKESNIEGVAIHDGPESCVDVREGVGEVLTGVHVGGAIELCNPWSRGADAVVKAEGNIGGALSRAVAGPRAVKEPRHAWKLHPRERGGPVVARVCR